MELKTDLLIYTFSLENQETSFIGWIIQPYAISLISSLITMKDLKLCWTSESHGRFVKTWIYRVSRFLGGWDGKVSACNVGDPGSILGLGRSSGEGNGNQLQYPCLENPMDRGAWYATVHGVAKSRTRLSYFIHSLTSNKEGLWKDLAFFGTLHSNIKER